MTLYPVAVTDFLDRSAYYPNNDDPAAGHWLQPALAPEKGRGPRSGKDRRNAKAGRRIRFI